jgi:hypothetical protein
MEILKHFVLFVRLREERVVAEKLFAEAISRMDRVKGFASRGLGFYLNELSVNHT